MTVRKRRKKNKLRGQRTHGQGDTKNRRGAGSRGGRGRAGSHKHKFTKYAGEFGQNKKKVLGKAKGLSINLDQIEQALPKWVAAGKAEKNGKEFFVDGNKAGFSKIVGMGTIKSKVVFENVTASKKALEKLEESGCEIKEKAAKQKQEPKEGKEGAPAKEKEGKAVKAEEKKDGNP